MSLDRGTPQPAEATSISYIPGLDGLRALSVIAVMWYHDSKIPVRGGGLRGGFLGVDAFFVVSGFLITSLLIAEFDRAGRISLRAFWVRRLRRLFPALIVLLVGVSAYAAFVARPVDLVKTRGDAIATLLYFQNWRIVLGAPAGSIFSHAWSLSVEEQWYLFWPIAMAIALRHLRRSHTVLMIVALALGSAIWTKVIAGWRHGVLHSFYGTDARAQTLLVGAAVAFTMPAIRRTRVSSIRIVGWFGAMGALLGVAFANGSSALVNGGRGLYALAVVALVVSVTVDTNGRLTRALCARPLRFVGRISYGLYLFHWPLYWILTSERVGVSGGVLLALRVSATFGVAMMSYRFVEMPVRNGALRAWMGLSVCVVSATLAIALVFAVTGSANDNVALDAPPLSRATELAYAGLGRSAPAAVAKVLVVGDGTAFQFGFAGPSPYRSANMFGAVFGTITCGLARGKFATHGALRTDLPTCSSQPQDDEKVIAAFQPTTVVLMVGAREVLDRWIDGRVVPLASREAATLLQNELRDFAAMVAAHHAKFAIVAAPCAYPFSSSRSHSDAASESQRIAWVNAQFRVFSQRETSLVIDVDSLFCGSKAISGLRGSGGVTAAGAASIWRAIESVVGRDA